MRLVANSEHRFLRSAFLRHATAAPSEHGLFTLPVELAKPTRGRYTGVMTVRNSLLFGLAIVASQLSAAEFRLPSLEVKPRIYSNVVVLGANETDLYFKHDQGMTNVKLKHLSPELQKQFGYDQAKAAAAEKRLAEETQRFNESLARTIQSESLQRARSPAAPEDDSLADPISDRSLLNRPAPALAVEKWLGPKPDLQGKFTIVFFWTTASAPCRRVIPELNSLQKKFGDQMVVVGVSPETEQQLAEMTEPRIEFYTALDSKSKLANLAGVTAIPQILLIDPNNIVRYQGHPAAVNEKILQNVFARFAGEQ
jgi:cytochrome c biogenesis protein CcmG/thiol:disulfide interchange protein DsbE